MEEVKENTRASITSGLNRNTVLNRPSVKPTVGAGGQYNVQVQAQPEGKFSKLAKGLSAFNTTLGAIAESNVAASNLADQQESEMSLEEIEENTKMLKETEDQMYEQNGFIDRLTRTGKMSVVENPLTFSRAQRAAGSRIASEKYKGELTKRLQEAQKEFRTNGTPYVIEEIQQQLQGEISGQFSMEEGSSIQRGFSDIASKVNADTRQRYFDEQTRTGAIIEVGNTANSLSDAFQSSSLESRKAIIGDIIKRNQHLGGDGYIKAVRIALDNLASKNPDLAQEIVNEMRDGNYSSINMGGFKMGSAVFDGALDDAEASIDREKRKIEADTDKQLNDQKKVWQEVATALNSRGNDLVTPSEYGISVSGFDGDSQVPANDLLDAYRVSEISKGALTGQRRVAESAFDSIDYSLKGRQATLRSRNESATRKDIVEATSSEEVTQAAVAFKMQLNTAKSSVDSKSMANQYKVVEMNNSVSNKVKAIDAATLNGRYPDGYEPIQDDDNNPIDWFALSPEQRRDVITKAKSKVYNDFNDKLVQWMDTEAKVQEARQSEKFDKGVPDAEQSSISDMKESMDIPPALSITAKAPQYLSWNLAKASAGKPEEHNYLISIPRDSKVYTLKKLNAAIKDGVYALPPRKTGRDKGKISRTTLDLEEIQKVKSMASGLDSLTPYTLDDMQSYNGKTGYFSSRGTTRDADALATAPFQYSSDEEANQIVDEVKKYYPPYTRAMLEASKLEPKEVTAETQPQPAKKQGRRR